MCKSMCNVNISIIQIFKIILQGKKGRPGEDGALGPKGQKVRTPLLTYVSLLSYMKVCNGKKNK